MTVPRGMHRAGRCYARACKAMESFDKRCRTVWSGQLNGDPGDHKSSVTAEVDSNIVGLLEKVNKTKSMSEMISWFSWPASLVSLLRIMITSKSEVILVTLQTPRHFQGVLLVVTSVTPSIHKNTDQIKPACNEEPFITDYTAWVGYMWS